MVKQIVHKIVTAGEGGTGKTTLLHRYINDCFKSDLKMTIGVDFFVKTIIHDDINHSLQIWDFGGQERFRFMMESYVMGAKGALLLIDLTRLGTLKHIDEWVQILRKFESNLPILLVGTKLDLEDKISIDDDYALTFVEKYQFSGYLKISSKTGENVELTFDTLLREILKFRSEKKFIE
ncbi:MAG: Rab family GTPase [Promethearchaeota archaeon]